MVALIVIFSIQNAEAVKVVFWVWKVEISLALLMVVCVGAGIMIAAVANLFNRDKKKAPGSKQVKNEHKPRGAEEKDLQNNKKGID